MVSFALENAIFSTEIPHLGPGMPDLGAQPVSSNCARDSSVTTRPFAEPKAILDS